MTFLSLLFLICLFTRSSKRELLMDFWHFSTFFFFLVVQNLKHSQMCSVEIKDKHSTSVSWLIDQNVLAKELHRGCYGSEYNLIRHLVISLTPYNPTLLFPFLLFSVNCPEIHPNPSETCSLFWNLHTAKTSIMWQRLHSKQSCPALIRSPNVYCRHATFHGICIPVACVLPLLSCRL